jgi:mannose-6-phosphate isomerase
MKGIQHETKQFVCGFAIESMQLGGLAGMTALTMGIGQERANKEKEAQSKTAYEPACLVSIAPKPGNAVFIPAGTVHTLGDGVVVFEVQQNSDVTFRLYDWGHLDAKTGKPRPLQVEQAFACIDFAGNAGGMVAPRVETTTPVERELLFDCEPFRLWRLLGQAPFPVGAAGEPRVLVCVGGAGQLEYAGVPYAVGKGDVWLLPAEVGVCAFKPNQEVTLLDIAIPLIF